MGLRNILFLAQQFNINQLGEIKLASESFKLLVKRDNEYTVVSL